MKMKRQIGSIWNLKDRVLAWEEFVIWDRVDACFGNEIQKKERKSIQCFHERR